MTLINVPVSAGELLDKVTILRIKRERIDDPAKLGNIKRELDLLEGISGQVLDGKPDCGPLIEELFAVNAKLWDIEDGKRDCERRQAFGEDFIQLARSVYIENDRRAAIKRQINDLMGSEIVEEKSYRGY